MKSVDFLKALGAVVCITVASGSVYAQDEAASPATGAATSQHGAKSVRKADRKLGYSVRRALAKAQGIDVRGIVVRSRGGAITLTGTVPDQSQIDRAADVARGVEGVTSVTNRLTVKQE
jgi:osmotically-inducible protein OsmY